jgi:putative membrane protein
VTPTETTTDGWPPLSELLEFEPQGNLVIAAFALLSAIAYLAGVIRVRRARRRWSPARSIPFLIGCALLLMVSITRIESYGNQLLSVFMFQQLTLMIAAPPLLVLGSPLRLLVMSVRSRRVRRAALRAARSRAVGAVLHPAISVPLFLLSYYGLYLGPGADALLGSAVGHDSLEIGLLIAGIVFAIPIVSDDPIRYHRSPGGRIIDVTVEMALHAFFGVIMMMSETLLVPAFAESTRALGTDPLVDQGVAGGLAWGYGEGPTVLLLLLVMHRWFRSEKRGARRTDQAAEVELEQYNAYLESLRRRRPDS